MLRARMVTSTILALSSRRSPSERAGSGSVPAVTSWGSALCWVLEHDHHMPSIVPNYSCPHDSKEPRAQGPDPAHGTLFGCFLDFRVFHQEPIPRLQIRRQLASPPRVDHSLTRSSGGGQATVHVWPSHGIANRYACSMTLRMRSTEPSIFTTRVGPP